MALQTLLGYEWLHSETMRKRIRYADNLWVWVVKESSENNNTPSFESNNILELLYPESHKDHEETKSKAKAKSLFIVVS